MKLYIFTRYTRLGASSRLRFYQYVTYFEKYGFTCEIVPLFNDDYLKQLYSRQKISKLNIAKSYWQVFKKLLKVGKKEIVLVEKELFPFMPAWVEFFLAKRGVKYIVDYDDAIFHNYDLSSFLPVKWMLGNKIKRVMKNAAAVVVGNQYLGNYARSANAQRIEFIPTVVDVEKYNPQRNIKDKIVIGWIGSPSTLKYLLPLKDLLLDLCKKYNARLHIVGGNKPIGIGEFEEVIAWSEENEVALINEFDIGIMPLEKTPWEEGKCGYKLIQYMGCGLPVIGSPIGINNDIIENGINGFKATSLAEWESALEKLIKSKELRESMGDKGRDMTIQYYSVQKMAPKWASVIKDIAAYD